MGLFDTIPASATKGVVIHHWDTDGLTSAALLLNYFSKQFPNIKVEPFVPIVGNYYLTEDQYAYLQQQGYEFVLTCDINFPAATVQRLAELFPKQVYMFDHHKQAPYTQVHYYNEPYPSCAAYINTLLGQTNNVLAVLGSVGDKEELIQQDTTFYPGVQEIMAEHELTFTQLLEMRRLIDANYIMNDYTGMLETINLLRDDPQAVLTDVRLQEHVATIMSEMNRLLALPLTVLSSRVTMVELDSKYHLLSHATRILSRTYPEKVIFTYQHQGHQITCYVRRRDVNYNMTEMITYARNLGLNAGGKDDVAGIIAPIERWSEIFPKLKQQLATIV